MVRRRVGRGGCGWDEQRAPCESFWRQSTQRYSVSVTVATQAVDELCSGDVVVLLLPVSLGVFLVSSSFLAFPSPFQSPESRGMRN